MIQKQLSNSSSQLRLQKIPKFKGFENLSPIQQYSSKFNRMSTNENHKNILVDLQALIEKKQQIKDIKDSFINYIKHSQQIYQEYMSQINEEIISMDQTISKISITSNKCYEIRSYTKIINKVCQKLKKNAKENLNALKDIKEDEKIQIKFKLKYQDFKMVEQKYYKEQSNYNIQYNRYKQKCLKLDMLLQSLKQQQDPIVYYNGNQIEEYLNILKQRYQKCQNIQQNLITQCQVLKQKDLQLVNIMKQLSQKYVGIYQKNIQIILNCIAVVIDIKPTKIQQGDKTQNYDDLGLQEMKKYTQIYSQKKKNSQKLSQLSDILDSKAISHSAFYQKDCDMLEDRCLFIKNKQMKNAQDVQEQRKILLQQFQKQINLFQKMDKQFSNINNIFLEKNQKLGKFSKEAFAKCFGDNILQVLQLSLLVIDFTRGYLNKISQVIKDKKDQLIKVIDSQTISMKKYQKSIQKLMKQHCKLKQVMVSSSSNQSSQNYKNKTIDMFNQFKKLYDNLIKDRKNRDHCFNQIVSNISNSLKKLVEQAHRQILEKQQYRHNLYYQIKPQSQVINIIKLSQVYDILFQEKFHRIPYQKFKSLINRNQYQRIKKILQNKNLGQKNLKINKPKQNSRLCVPCMPYPRSDSDEYQKLFPCTILLKDNQNINGQICIKKKSINFNKQKSIFQKDLSLLIPSNDLKRISKQLYKKDETNYRQLLVLETLMGSISIDSDQLNQIQQRIKIKITWTQNNQGFPNKRQSSSIIGKIQGGSGSTQTKIVSPLSSINGRSKTEVSRIQDNLIQEFEQKLKTSKLFAQSFTIQYYNQKDKELRANYSYSNGYLKFQVKQLRKIESLQNGLLVIVFIWKISFQAQSLMKSYQHQERVKISIVSNTFKVEFTQKKKKQIQKYHGKVFYHQVQKLNQVISDYLQSFFTIKGDIVNVEESQSYIIKDISLDNQDDIFELNKLSMVSKRESDKNLFASILSGFQN